MVGEQFGSVAQLFDYRQRNMMVCFVVGSRSNRNWKVTLVDLTANHNSVAERPRQLCGVFDAGNTVRKRIKWNGDRMRLVLYRGVSFQLANSLETA